MFELDVEREFSAAHNLRGYNGNCSEKHGHNWGVLVKIRAEELDSIGIAVDFKALKRELDSVLAGLDHRDLNTVPPFDRINPTSENLAKYVYGVLKARLNFPNAKIYSVRISESRSSGATYFEE